MKKQLFDKIKESIFSVIPISVIVIIISFFIPLGVWPMVGFILATLMVIIGMSLFTLGAEMSMMNVGQGVGKYITEKRKLWLLLLLPFLIGMIVTIAEPDLIVLANQVSINNMLLICMVAIGVGVFLMFAVLRVVLKIDIRIILVVSYILVFIFIFNIPSNLVPLAFDSGGVTTGPMTVPFIMAVGLGIASINGEKSNKDDSFGYVALCSIGPILSVVVLCLFTKVNVNTDSSEIVVDSFSSFGINFGNVLTKILGEVALALLPIVIVSLIFELIIFKENKKKIVKTFIGIGYSYIGLVLLLTGANMGFMPIAQSIGSTLGSSTYSWVLIPLGMIMGFFVVMAEPAVHVLNHQVEEVSGGTISKRLMLFSLAIGVAVSIGLAMTRVIFDFSIMWIIIPGYAIALILTIFVPKMFSSIAFDSGGVASGPMTATFLLPLATGACQALYYGENSKMLANGFGIVALVAMTPLIVIQLLGLIYQIKLARKVSRMELPYEDVIYFDIDIHPEVMYE